MCVHCRNCAELVPAYFLLTNSYSVIKELAHSGASLNLAEVVAQFLQKSWWVLGSRWEHGPGLFPKLVGKMFEDWRERRWR
jgi:hypothetical protein